MNNSQKEVRVNISFWRNPRYWLYHHWAALYSTFMENFNLKWREPLPPIPCEICGETGHKTKYCPNAKKMGFEILSFKRSD
ncbi:MAG: hypothetical protein KJZ77_05245 [Anaerolineales bacterium]|nr:hypothetical protein [Anaerolineales bacterium]